MKRAFSLIELLIGLIIISIITAAFLPTMTNKIKYSNVSISQGNNKKVTNQCAHTGSNDCKLCYEGETVCLLCFANCISGQYADNTSCQCKSCSEFGAACQSCDKNGCTKCSSGYGLSGGVCTQCAAGYVSDGLHSCSACTGERQYSHAGAGTCLECVIGKKANSSHSDCENITCGNGQYLNGNDCVNCPSGNYCINNAKFPCASGYWQDLTGQASCKECIGAVGADKTFCCKYGTILRFGECYNPCAHYGNSFFIPTIGPTNGICMTKYNAGDDLNTIKIPSEVTIKQVSAAKSGASSKTCWGRGNASDANDIITSSSDIILSTVNVYPGYNSFSYSTNNRVVCNWVAANAICKGNSTNGKTWRLPTKSELEYILNNADKVSRGLGSDGLQLCDSVGGLNCSNSSSQKCLIADFAPVCYPNFIHGVTLNSNYSYYLEDFKQVDSYYLRYQPRSVRCVVDVTF